MRALARGLEAETVSAALPIAARTRRGELRADELRKCVQLQHAGQRVVLFYADGPGRRAHTAPRTGCLDLHARNALAQHTRDARAATHTGTAQTTHTGARAHPPRRPPCPDRRPWPDRPRASSPAPSLLVRLPFAAAPVAQPGARQRERPAKGTASPNGTDHFQFFSVESSSVLSGRRRQLLCSSVSSIYVCMVIRRSPLEYERAEK